MTASWRMARVSAAVSTNDGRCSRPSRAALYRRWQPSISSGPAASPAGLVRVAMITGSSRSVPIAYSGSKSGPGPIRETVCGLLPGAGISP